MIFHAGIFSKSLIGRSIKNKTFDVPESKFLPSTNVLAPHVFLGDEAFPLLDTLLIPFRRDTAVIDKTKAIFNLRLSRGRRLVENSFGLLAQRFRIFHTLIDLNITTVENLVTSACIIHNLMVDELLISDQDLTIDNVQNNRRNLHWDMNNNQTYSGGQDIRNIFKDYFNGVGAVHWQDDAVNGSCNRF